MLKAHIVQGKYRAMVYLVNSQIIAVVIRANWISSIARGLIPGGGVAGAEFCDIFIHLP